MPACAAKIIDLWGGPTVAMSHPLDRPAVISRLDPGVLENPTNRYLLDWACPQGLIDSMAIPLARDATVVAPACVKPI
jgi:hypothetical protein